MRRILEVGLFLFVFSLLYLITVGVTTRVEIRGISIMDRLLPRPIQPGGYTQTLGKFRGIEGVGSVDLVFAGSSHSYRSFDPRIFAEAGITSYNLGSGSQTPINSHFLLREHWSQLSPKLLVYEIYPLMLTTNGMESFHDLAVNLPLSPERWKMALATRDPRAVSTLTSVAWRRAWQPLNQESQSEFPPDRIVGLGYVQRGDTMQRISLPEPTDLVIAKQQLEYLSRIVGNARGRGAQVLFVSQPVLPSLTRVFRGYDRVKDRVEELAASHGIPYIDFQSLEGLRWDRHFFDANHLNQAGVRRFNRALLDSLTSRDLVPVD